MKIELKISDFKTGLIIRPLQLYGGQSQTDDNRTSYSAGCTDGDVGCCDTDEPSDYLPKIDK